MALATLEGVEEVRSVEHWKLWVRFEDGVEGEVDVSSLSDKPMFAALRDREFFDTVHVCMKVVSWGDGLELDPCWFYRLLAEPA